MSILTDLQLHARARGLSIEEIIDPITEKACVTRDSFIHEMAMRGCDYGEIQTFLGVARDYIKAIREMNHAKK